MSETLLQMVERHEGFRASVYCDLCGKPVTKPSPKFGNWLCPAPCPGGNLTVGHGTRVDGDCFGRELAQAALFAKLSANHNELVKLRWFVELDTDRQNAIEDLAYAAGVDGVLTFHNMIDALERGDFKLAASHLMRSRFAQKAPSRAMDLERIIATGAMAA